MKVEKPNLPYSVYHRFNLSNEPLLAKKHCSFKSIKEIIKNKEDHIVIHYKDIRRLILLATVKKI